MYLCSMIVCVAEKPTMGRDIARVLGANSRHDGYMEGNGYYVTWTFGHLCTLYEPQDYAEEWKGWNLSALPMIPDRFAIKVQDDEGIRKQLGVIRDLISKSELLINCGDAGQEGELIQRWVYQKAGCRIPVKRLWLSSTTEEAIRDAFQSLKDQSEYQRLYEAGLMRAIGDWLLGMNATRAYTIRYAKGTGKDRQVLSVGRVQTPTLALIVHRQEEIEHFVPRTYWELKTVYRDTLFTAQLPTEEGEYAINRLEQGEALMASIKDNPFTIDKIEKKKGKESAPKLYDLPTLQVECNKKFSLSPDETMKIAQSLYEKHVTTYPRVDTTFLPDDMYKKIPATLQGIKDFYPQIQPLLSLKADGGKGEGSLPKSKKVFDSKKVTDHYAIIPTGQRPDGITEAERRVYDLIVQRFISNFYPECQVANTTVFGSVPPTEKDGSQGEPIVFKVTKRTIESLGWREVYQWKRAENGQWVKTAEEVRDDDDGTKEEDTVGSLPTFVKGESGVHTPKLQEKTTTPPPYYTEGTIIRAMQTAGKTVEDEEMRELMKQNGIGRPSTYGEIIKKLFQRKYIVSKGKSIRATELGISLIHTIISPLLKSAELTGQWEKKLRQIESGEYEAKQFLDELKAMTRTVVYDVKANKAGMQCPVCRQGIIIRGNTRYGCSRWREGCSYAEPFA